jgi:hypothetical protein
MGIKEALSRKDLIRSHVQSMRDYTWQLRDSLWSWVSRKAVIHRITECARSVERAEAIITQRERELEG